MDVIKTTIIKFYVLEIFYLFRKEYFVYSKKKKSMSTHFTLIVVTWNS